MKLLEYTCFVNKYSTIDVRSLIFKVVHYYISVLSRMTLLKCLFLGSLQHTLCKQSYSICSPILCKRYFRNSNPPTKILVTGLQSMLQFKIIKDLLYSFNFCEWESYKEFTFSLKLNSIKVFLKGFKYFQKYLYVYLKYIVSISILYFIFSEYLYLYLNTLPSIWPQVCPLHHERWRGMVRHHQIHILLCLLVWSINYPLKH